MLHKRSSTMNANCMDERYVLLESQRAVDILANIVYVCHEITAGEDLKITFISMAKVPESTRKLNNR